MGLLAMIEDLGWKLRGEVWSDANAAIGMIHRNGLVKTRHIETGLLWIQQTAAQQRLKFSEVAGRENPADLNTKHLDTKTINDHLSKLEYHEAAGRVTEAPTLHIVGGDLDNIYSEGREEANAVCGWVRAIMEMMSITKGRPNARRRGSQLRECTNKTESQCVDTRKST